MIIKCVFPEHLIQEPIINQLGNEFDIVTSIKQAKITPDVGWVVLDVLGEELEIQKSIVWLAEKGIGIQIVKEEIV